MKTRAEMVDDALNLALDSERQLVLIVAFEPQRQATARVVLADAVRVHELLSSRQPFKRIAPEVAARLKRANLLTQALNNPMQ